MFIKVLLQGTLMKQVGESMTYLILLWSKGLLILRLFLKALSNINASHYFTIWKKNKNAN